jgi:hypothetical protein
MNNFLVDGADIFFHDHPSQQPFCRPQIRSPKDNNFSFMDAGGIGNDGLAAFSTARSAALSKIELPLDFSMRKPRIAPSSDTSKITIAFKCSSSFKLGGTTQKDLTRSLIRP